MFIFVNKEPTFPLCTKNSLQLLNGYIIITIRYSERMFNNMKKITAVVLGIALLVICFTGCTQNKTVYYTDKDNFEMVLYPNSADGKVFSAGLNAIQIIMNTPNIESGNGEIRIYDASDDRLMAMYDVRIDGNKLYINKSTDPAYSQVILFLPEEECFESGKSYYVVMDEECFYIDYIKGFSGAVNKGDWQFTIADYGYDGNISEMPITYLVGNKISIPIKLGGDAVSAVLMYDNVSVVNSDLRELSENGTFELETLSEGTTTISIMFLDKDGMYIETLAFSVTIK